MPRIRQTAEHWAEIGRICREARAALSRARTIFLLINPRLTGAAKACWAWDELVNDVCWQASLLFDDCEDQGYDRMHWPGKHQTSGPEADHGYGWERPFGKRGDLILTREQWVVVGDDIKRARHHLMELACRLKDDFGDPHLTVKQAKPWRKLRDRLCVLRCELEETLWKQHPDWGDPALRVMYGPLSTGERRSTSWKLPPDSEFAKKWFARRQAEAVMLHPSTPDPTSGEWELAPLESPPTLSAN